jgi:hypothetical protein
VPLSSVPLFLELHTNELDFSCMVESHSATVQPETFFISSLLLNRRLEMKKALKEALKTKGNTSVSSKIYKNYFK